MVSSAMDCRIHRMLPPMERLSVIFRAYDRPAVMSLAVKVAPVTALR